MNSNAKRERWLGTSSTKSEPLPKGRGFLVFALGGSVFVFSVVLVLGCGRYQVVMYLLCVYVENVCGVGYNGISWKLANV